MDHRQLGTRLGRITDRQKLRNFIQVADEEGNFELCDRARVKLLELHGEASTHVRRNPTPEADDPQIETPREEQVARRRSEKPVRKIRKKPEKAKVRVVRFHRR